MLEKAYLAARSALNRFRVQATPIFRRVLRFLALPYCYVAYVDWEECTRSRLQVAGDLLYIFFVLKSFPENYGYCRLWAQDRSEWRYYYGSNYDAFHRYRLEKHVQRPEYRVLFSDKEVCQQLCDGSGLAMPQMLGTIDPSQDYPRDLRRILMSAPGGRAVIKPTRGSAGKGVLLGTVEGEDIWLERSGERVSLEDFILPGRSVVQRFISLDPELARLSPAASIRIVTVLTRDGRVIFLATEINMAATDSFLSNWSEGGVAVIVDPDSGRLREVGHDRDAREHLESPLTGVRFADFVIPRWDEILELAERVQKTFSYYKMLGPDITLTEDGPMLYEINATPDLAALEQHGPLLKKQEILAEFGGYDLLVNKHQRQLWRAALTPGSNTTTPK